MKANKQEIWIGGTKFDNTQQFNKIFGMTIFIVGFLPYFYGIKWLAWAMWVFGLLGFLAGFKK